MRWVGGQRSANIEDRRADNPIIDQMRWWLYDLGKGTQTALSSVFPQSNERTRVVSPSIPTQGFQWPERSVPVEQDPKFNKQLMDANDRVQMHKMNVEQERQKRIAEMLDYINDPMNGITTQDAAPQGPTMRRYNPL